MKPTPEQQAAIDEVNEWLRQEYAGLDETKQALYEYELFYVSAPHVALDESRPETTNDEDLVNRAGIDPTAWEIAREVAQRRLEDCQPLPPALSKFIAGVLSGSNKKPKPIFRTNSNLREPVIAEAVWRLTNAGVGITYSRSPGSEPHSASDYVAEMLSTNEIKDPKSWEAVRKIYEKEKDWLEMAHQMRALYGDIGD